MQYIGNYDASSDVDALHSYQLPDHILPLAPRRPFGRFSATALADACARAREFPESRGMMSRAARHLGMAPTMPEPENWIVMEAHFDALNVPQAMADELVSLGFELDGFARFNPDHFTDHFTLKFKLSAGDKARRAKLLRYLRDRCRDAQNLAGAVGVECYLEVEVYAERNRRHWPTGGMSDGWHSLFPLAPGQLVTRALPCTEAEAKRSGVSLHAAKRADIHVKIAHAPLGVGDRAELISRFVAAGFYAVLTWSGNDVCTAQFLNGADAARAFRLLELFFALCGGASEMTLEPCISMWRSQSATTGRFAAAPPLAIAILP